MLFVVNRPWLIRAKSKKYIFGDHETGTFAKMGCTHAVNEGVERKNNRLRKWGVHMMSIKASSATIIASSIMLTMPGTLTVVKELRAQYCCPLSLQ